MWAAALTSGVLAMPASQLFAADNTETPVVNVATQPRFDGKINTWVEGTIISIDAAAGKFVARGAKRPYATAYAKMMNDVLEKTRNLTGADKQAKEAEVRTAWRDKLAAANKEPFDKNSDFTFRIPPENSIVTSFDESRYYGKEYEYAPVPNAPKGMSDKEAINMITLKNLRIGEHVVIGYASGMVHNDAYVVFKANYTELPNGDAESITGRSDRTDVATPAAPATEVPAKADNTKVNVRDRDKDAVTADQQKQNSPDLQITRNIRRAVVKDDSLSTYAHNVKIITQDGNVTLKGPVRSVSEKNEIERKAVDVAGKEHVTNQIEIAP